MMLKLLALLLCLFLNAFFSAAEIAIIALTKVKLKKLVKDKRYGSEALFKLKSEPQKLFSVIQVGVNGVGMAASALVAVITLQLFGSYWVALGTAVIAFAVIIFGEIIPKNFAYSHSEDLALLSAKPLLFFDKLFYPATFLINSIVRTVLKDHTKTRHPQGTEEELKAMLTMGVESGQVEKKEKELIEKVFQLNDIAVEEIMTPRVNMFCLNADTRLKNALKDIIQHSYSRIPLYRKSKDNMVGILHVKDAFIALSKNKNPKLAQLAINPPFVPKGTLLNQLFKQFQEKKIHMAIVVDEFGGVVGVVTLEDLLEEIVGEIIDESDVTANLIKRIDKNTILVDGNTELKDIFKFCNIQLPGKDYEKINKIVLKKLGRIPKVGEEVNLSSEILLKIEESTRNKILKIRIIKLHPPQQPTTRIRS